MIDEHLGVSIAGLTADAQLLWFILLLFFLDSIRSTFPYDICTVYVCVADICKMNVWIISTLMESQCPFLVLYLHSHQVSSLLLL